MTLTSNYSMNMFGNSFMNQYSLNSFIGGGNIHYDCFGQPNFNAMAGTAVANALLGVAMQAVSTNIQNKEAKVNYTQELVDISKEIENKEIDKAEQTDIINTQTETINTAKATKQTLSEELKNLESELATKKSDYETAAKQDPAPANLADLKNLYEDAKKAVEEKKAEIAEQEKLIKEAEAKKEAAEAEEAKLQKEIDELKDKQAVYQKAADEETIKDSKSTSWQRADETCIKDWQETDGEKQATKKELKRAIYEYKHAENDEDKKEAAIAVKNMFESNEDGLKDYKCIYEAIIREENL